MNRWFLIVLTAAVVAVPAAFGDDATEEKKVKLFNGEDFEGWKLFIPDEDVDPKTVWSVENGTIHCKGKPTGYMRTTEKYGDYKLTFQWRWPEGGGNSGLLMHISLPDRVWPKSIEGQLQSRHAGDFWVIGGTDFKEHTNKSDRRVPKSGKDSEAAPGKWNTMVAVCKGNTIELSVNGVLQNKATETTVTEGYIGLQSEGTPIEFRHIVLERLD